MKLDSTLGKVALSMSKIATAEDPVLDQEDRKDKLVRIKAAQVTNEIISKEENIKLQYARIEERKERYNKIYP